MKQLIGIFAIVFALSSAHAADAPKAPAAKKAAPAKCVPSKEVVCDKNLQGKTRPTPKKKAEPKDTK